MLYTRFVFHVPEHYIDATGVVGSCDNSAFVEELLKRLRSIKPRNLIIHREKCIVDGIELWEKIICTYTDNRTDAEAAKIFAELVSKYHKDLKQEEYKYEMDNIEVHIKIGEEED